jgi:glycine hydroxymethyltransferase
VKNSQELAKSLMELGYTVHTNGTENHLVLLYLKSKGLLGNELETLLEKACLYPHKYQIIGDPASVKAAL